MSAEWIETTLGEVCSSQKGTIQTGPFGSQLHASDYVETGIPVVMPANIGADGGISEDGIARIQQADADRLAQHKLQMGDVIFSRRGDVTRNALVEPHQVGWLCGTGCLKVRLGNESKADAKFISYCLRLPGTKEWLIRHAVGATMPNLNTSILSAVPITVPPLVEQRKITTVLRALDDRITLLRETNATMEAMAQALFKSWFVDFDPVHANAGTRAATLPAELQAMFPSTFTDTPQGPVPMGWRLDSLASLMDIAGGTQPPASEFLDEPQEGYIRLIQIRDYETDAHLTFVPKTGKLRTTSAEDIMIARYGASVGRICWGLDGAYNVALVRVVCNSNNREFLRTYLQSNVFQAGLAAVSGRSAQSGFNKGDIASFKLVIPPDEMLALYQNTIWPMRTKILHNRKQAQTLAVLRDTLLPRLISGQLRLPDAAAALAEVGV